MIDWYIIAIVLITGYIIGLLQKGININIKSNHSLEPKLDEEGKPVYNESHNSLPQDYREWLEMRDS